MLKKNFTPKLDVLKDQDGTAPCSKANIQERQTQYCSSLYESNAGRDEIVKEVGQFRRRMDEIPNKTLLDEIRKATIKLTQSKIQVLT